MKNKFQIVKEILLFIVVVAGAFLYSMLTLGIISFVFLSVIHIHIKVMIGISIATASLAAIVYPIVRVVKLRKERDKEESLKDYHRQK